MATVNCLNTYIVPTTNNEVTKPAQPAFSARPNTTVSNVTGDGTLYIAALDTEIFDQNNDFNTGTYTFTAPVTGSYYFSGHVSIMTTGVATLCDNIIATSNHPFKIDDWGNISNIKNPGGNFYTTRGVFCDMDAADTALLQIRVYGTTKTVSVSGFDTLFGTGLTGSLVV